MVLHRLTARPGGQLLRFLAKVLYLVLRDLTRRPVSPDTVSDPDRRGQPFKFEFTSPRFDDKFEDDPLLQTETFRRIVVNLVAAASLMENGRRNAAEDFVERIFEAQLTSNFPATLPQPHAPLVCSTFREALHASVSAMRDGHRYHAILAARLGLDGSEKTLDRVGQDFGLTRERIRQICKKILCRLQAQPIGKAVQATVSAVLAERGFVTTDELLQLVPWLGGSLTSRSLELVLHEIYPACSRAYEDLGLISRVPRTHLEAVLQSWDLKVGALPRRVVFSSALSDGALEVAQAHGLPLIVETLVRTARNRVANQHQTFTAFVGELIADSTEPISVSELVEAATEAGFDVSEGQARNTLSLISGVYPLGHAIFATFGQTFGATSALLESIAAHIRDIVHGSPSKQWHANELLTIVSREFGFAGAEAIGDAHRLAVLLRERTQLTYLGRLVFVAESESRRLELIPLARNVLELAGTPLLKATLLARVKEKRGFTDRSLQIIFDALIEVSPNTWGLPERDMPLSALEIELLCEDAWAMLRPGEVVSVREIRSRLIALGSPEVEKVEATLLRSVLRRDQRFKCSGSEGIILADTHGYDIGWTPGKNIA